MSTTQHTLDDTTNTDSNEHNTTNTDTLTNEINNKDDIFTAVETLIDDILNTADEDETREIVETFLEQISTTGVHRYSTRNRVALINQLHDRDADWTNNPKHFAGYNTWQNEHGRHVKQGETGFKVLAPVTAPTCPECGNAPNYHTNHDELNCDRAGTDPDTWDINPRDEWSRGVIYYQTATTFAYSQTEPLDDADPEDVFEPVEYRVEDNGNAQAHYDTLKTAAENGEFGEPINVHEVGAETLGLTTEGGSTGTGEIYIKTQDNTGDQFHTLVHEIAHEQLHDSDDRDTMPRGVKEVEAEAVTYTVAEYFGFNTDNLELYVRQWADSVADTAAEHDDTSPEDLIEHRLETVQNVAADIIDEIRGGDEHDD